MAARGLGDPERVRLFGVLLPGAGSREAKP
jgi:hypothetical protein